LGYVYVADTDNHRIQKFDGNGTFITTWGSQGSAEGQFNMPDGISVENLSGTVYVADGGNNRIQAFIKSQ
jgi:DNA-binding beta-propeller fold protein YncE